MCDNGKREHSYRHRWGEAGPRFCVLRSDTAVPHCPAGCIQGHSWRTQSSLQNGLRREPCSQIGEFLGPHIWWAQNLVKREERGWARPAMAETILAQNPFPGGSWLARASGYWWTHCSGPPYYQAQVRVDYRVRAPLSLYVNDLLFLPGQLLTVFRPRVGIFYFFCVTPTALCLWELFFQFYSPRCSDGIM